jgi:ParB-like chromosome segregation protein Spo0J
VKAHPFAERDREMTADEYAGLLRDMKAHGQRLPIVTYQGLILDGRHRFRACRELGIEPILQQFEGDEGAARDEVNSLNRHRRHLTIAERKAKVVEELKRDPAQSDRAIARKASVDDSTVRAARRAAEQGAGLPHHDKRRGADGVMQPATKRTRSDGRVLKVAPGKRLAEDRIPEIRALAESGHSVEQIADLQGVKLQRVRKLMDDSGIKVSIPKRGRPIDSAKIVRQSVNTLSGIAHGLTLAREIDIAPVEASELLTELREALKPIRLLDAKLKEIAIGK